MRVLLLRTSLVAAAGIGFVLACSSSSNGTNPATDAGPTGDDAGDDGSVDTRPPTPSSWDRPITRPDDSTAASQRAACAFKRGAMPAETTGPATKIDDMPIQNIVVLMQENRSFDSYFGHLPVPSGQTIEQAPASASNPDTAGGTTGSHPWMHAPHKCNADTDHSWQGSHLEFDDGKNDGFFQANNGKLDQGEDAGPYQDGGGALDGERAMWWYDQTDIPFHYQLAQTFAIADHYHCGTLGPTWPNRMYLYGASSYGRTSNDFPDLTAYPFPNDGTTNAVVFDELEMRHVDWNAYSDGSPGVGVILGFALAQRYDRNPTKKIQDFLDEAKAGTLPPVAFVDAKLGALDGPANDDEHPPAQIQIGQHFVWQIVDAVMHSPQWAHTALFITYDENGGIYDHVPPPKACKPDDLAPQLGAGDVGTAGGFDNYGFRVPFIVVSPYAKAGFVSHATYDHTSITRFIEAKFKIPALSGRDANADPFTDMFDWSSPAFATPPSIGEPAIDPTEANYCVANFSK